MNTQSPFPPAHPVCTGDNQAGSRRLQLLHIENLLNVCRLGKTWECALRMNRCHKLITVLLMSAWISIGGRTSLADDVMPLFGPEEVAATSAGTSAAKPPVTRSPASSPGQEKPLTQQTSSSTTSPPKAAPAGTADPRTRPQPQFSGEETSPDLQSQKEQRFRELKRQIEILSQLTDRPATSVSEMTSEDSADDSMDAVPQEGSHKSPRTVPAPKSSAPEPSEFPSNTRAGNATVPQLVPVKVPEEGPVTTPAPMVVEGTIDRFALATSLFGTQQWETCLDVLKQTNLTPLPREDQIWAEYMQACCHRRIGRNDLARQSYRRILSEKDADWIGQLARWWLDDLDAKAKLNTDVQRLSETLAAWENEIDTLSKTSARTATDQ